jgi:hypothetical protein
MALCWRFEFVPGTLCHHKWPFRLAVLDRQHICTFAGGWVNPPAMIHMCGRFLTANKDDMLAVGNPPSQMFDKFVKN